MTESDVPAAEQNHPPPNLDVIGRTCFALHARMTARLLTRRYDDAMRPLGLRSPQFAILGAISHETGLSETALAARLGLERTTLVRNLKLLERRGWIEAVPGERRLLSHRLTDSGRATLLQAIPLWQEAQTGIEQALRSDEPDLIRDALKSLRRASR